LWSQIEECDPVFAGIGDISLDLTISASNAKLWDGRALYYWCFNGAEGGAGVSATHQIQSAKTVEVVSKEIGHLLEHIEWLRSY
jgi:hypothetical protein